MQPQKYFPCSPACTGLPWGGAQGGGVGGRRLHWGHIVPTSQMPLESWGQAWESWDAGGEQMLLWGRDTAKPQTRR